VRNELLSFASAAAALLMLTQLFALTATSLTKGKP
jgi:hypothetical protein